MFDRIKGPINRIPNIFNNTVEMNDSVERVQEFLESKDKQENVMLKRDDPKHENPFVIQIKGNFSCNFGYNYFDP